MNSLTSDVKHEAERGLMVQVLVDWGLEWMPFYELRMQLSSRSTYRVTDDQVMFHLNYLVQAGYAESKQLRAGRSGVELNVVRGTAKAADLIAGNIPSDPGIAL